MQKNQLVPKAHIPRGTYIVASVDPAGNASISTTPKQHLSEYTATSEAKRLASVNPGKQFIVLRVTAVAMLPTSQPVLL